MAEAVVKFIRYTEDALAPEPVVWMKNGWLLKNPLKERVYVRRQTIMPLLMGFGVEIPLGFYGEVVFEVGSNRQPLYLGPLGSTELELSIVNTSTHDDQVVLEPQCVVAKLFIRLDFEAISELVNGPNFISN